MCNVHRVRLAASAEAVGALLDALGSPDDQVWPRESWPPIRFDGALSVGVAGAHGPVRYVVEDFRPGRLLRCRFTVPVGFEGTHSFVVTPDGDGAWFEHRVEITPRGWARLLWPLVFGPLHDALAEDAIARAVHATGGVATAPTWSLWVRILRLGR